MVMILPTLLLPLCLIILVKKAEVSPLFSICSYNNTWALVKHSSLRAKGPYEE
jgi:hypothetical protein